MKFLLVVFFACLSYALAAPAPGPIPEPNPNPAANPLSAYFYSAHYPYYYDHAPAYYASDLGYIGTPSVKYAYSPSYIPSYRTAAYQYYL